MTEQTEDTQATAGRDDDSIHDGRGTYGVVLLVEQALSTVDAAQVHSLHEDITDHVVYHVLIPLDDASARIEASLGALGAGDVMASPALAMSDVDLEAVRDEARRHSEESLQASLEALRGSGADAHGRIVSEPPVDALCHTVSEIDGREAIILTRPHVVAEFFHVDWTSRARRKLGVPVLHLLEHERFDEQAGGGEGVTGL
jgi:hypothetical protein